MQRVRPGAELVKNKEPRSKYISRYTWCRRYFSRRIFKYGWTGRPECASRDCASRDCAARVGALRDSCVRLSNSRVARARGKFHVSRIRASLAVGRSVGRLVPVSLNALRDSSCRTCCEKCAEGTPKLDTLFGSKKFAREATGRTRQTDRRTDDLRGNRFESWRVWFYLFLAFCCRMLRTEGA